MTRVTPSDLPPDAGRLAQDVGHLVQALRARTGLSQGRLAERVGTSQQWLSRVERGANNPRLSDIQRIFDVLGLRLVLATAPVAEGEDPDLLAHCGDAEREDAIRPFQYCLSRVFRDVRYVVAGRLAAVAQGAPVRVHRLDLVVAEADLDAVYVALSKVGCLRWSDRWQEFSECDPDPRGSGPLRWRIGFEEVRLQVVDDLPAAMGVHIGEFTVLVWPLADLEIVDEDVAEVMRRARLRGRMAGPLGGGG